MSENTQSSQAAKQEDDRGSKLQYLNSLTRIGLFYFAGLSIFFIVGFVIISLRVQGKENRKVPALVGHLYLDEHNTLADMGFKVELQRNYTTRYPFGYILSQSLSPGSIVKEGARLILLVNQSKNVIKVPKLVDTTMDVVPGFLTNIHIGSRSFELKLGQVTYVADAKPKGTVLAQYPPANTAVLPDTPVSLLVSDGPAAEQAAFKMPDLKGADFSIAQKIAFLYKMPVEIKVQKTDKPGLNGKITDFSFEANNKKASEVAGTEWQVTVARFEEKPAEDEDESDSDKGYPYTIEWLDLSENDIESGNYTITAKVFHDTSINAFAVEVDHSIEEYTPLAYIKAGKDPVPFFRQDRSKLAVYKGYPEQFKADVQEQETEEVAPEGATQVFQDETVPEEKAAVKEDKPVKYIELNHLTI